MENMLFPIHPTMHIALAIAAVLVFGMQFIRLHKKYHLVLAIAVPCSLLPHVIEGNAFFYLLGVAEVAALFLALILAKTVDRDKTPAETSGEEDA